MSLVMVGMVSVWSPFDEFIKVHINDEVVLPPIESVNSKESVKRIMFTY